MTEASTPSSTPTDTEAADGGEDGLSARAREILAVLRACKASQWPAAVSHTMTSLFGVLDVDYPAGATQARAAVDELEAAGYIDAIRVQLLAQHHAPVVVAVDDVVVAAQEASQTSGGEPRSHVTLAAAYVAAAPSAAYAAHPRNSAVLLVAGATGQPITSETYELVGRWQADGILRTAVLVLGPVVAASRLPDRTLEDIDRFVRAVTAPAPA